jgi:hypothetical protein
VARVNQPKKNKTMKISKTLLAVFATVLISCALCTQQAQATQITGNITFGGTVSLNTGSAGTATAVTAWHGGNGSGSPFVLSFDGDFTGFVAAFDPTTFAAPWNFNSGAVPSFWSVDGFTFNLTSSSIFSQGGFPPGVVVNGSGFVSGNGFDPTFMTWSFTTQDPGTRRPRVFSFSAAAGSVPDGGTTVMLLGAALGALGMARRFLMS